MFQRGQRWLIAVALGCLLFTTACAAPETQWDQIQEETRRETIADIATAEPIAGGEFNQFFPASGDGYDRTFTQEKQGFAEARLRLNGDEVAMLSVSDTATTPDAVAKFQSSSTTIAGYPSATIGSTQTAILVGDRLQVKVQSRSDNFTAADRAAWLEKFDLAGLAALVP